QHDPIYTLSLHDALPISDRDVQEMDRAGRAVEGSLGVHSAGEVAAAGDQLKLRPQRHRSVHPGQADRTASASGEGSGSRDAVPADRKSTRLNSSHVSISY